MGGKCSHHSGGGGGGDDWSRVSAPVESDGHYAYEDGGGLTGTGDPASGQVDRHASDSYYCPGGIDSNLAVLITGAAAVASAAILYREDES